MQQAHRLREWSKWCFVSVDRSVNVVSMDGTVNGVSMNRSVNLSQWMGQ